MTRIWNPLIFGACLAGVWAYWTYVLGFDFTWAEHWKWLGRHYWDHGTLPPGFLAPLPWAAGVCLAGSLHPPRPSSKTSVLHLRWESSLTRSARFRKRPTP